MQKCLVKEKSSGKVTEGIRGNHSNVRNIMEELPLEDEDEIVAKFPGRKRTDIENPMDRLLYPSGIHCFPRR